MIPSGAAGIAKQHQSDRLSVVLAKKGMSDSGSSPGNRSSPTGLQQVLEAQAGRQRAASAAARGAAVRAGGLPPTLGMSPGVRPPFSQRERMMAAIPPSLRASQSLDLAASMPPSLRPSQSLDLVAGAAIPPSLRSSQSLDLRPPALGRSSSIELAAARRAAGMGYSSMYDPRRLLLAQQAAAMPGHFFPGPIFGAHPMAGAAAGGSWRNMPANEGVTPQGLNLLRAASLSLPNRMGGLPPAGGRFLGRAPPVGAAAGAAAAAGGALGGPLPGQRVGFAPEPSKKRKAKDGDSSDEEEEGADKVFIPDVLDLDILCGRGGKSNHHAGNKRYRQVVSEMKNMYRSTEAKTVKTDLSRAIVDHVCSYGGRFVKKDSATGRYYLLTKAEARKKTSQALRETKALKWTM